MIPIPSIQYKVCSWKCPNVVFILVQCLKLNGGSGLNGVRGCGVARRNLEWAAAARRGTDGGAAEAARDELEREEKKGLSHTYK